MGTRGSAGARASTGARGSAGDRKSATCHKRSRPVARLRTKSQKPRSLVGLLTAWLSSIITVLKFKTCESVAIAFVVGPRGESGGGCIDSDRDSSNDSSENHMSLSAKGFKHKLTVLESNANLGAARKTSRQAEQIVTSKTILSPSSVAA